LLVGRGRGVFHDDGLLVAHGFVGGFFGHGDVVAWGAVVGFDELEGEEGGGGEEDHLEEGEDDEAIEEAFSKGADDEVWVGALGNAVVRVDWATSLDGRFAPDLDGEFADEDSVRGESSKPDDEEDAVGD